MFCTFLVLKIASPTEATTENAQQRQKEHFKKMFSLLTTNVALLRYVSCDEPKKQWTSN